MKLLGTSAILLDIEGTTTPITFVHEVLFPFARTHLHAYLHDDRNAGVVNDVGQMLQHEHGVDVVSGARPPLWHDASPEERLRSVEEYAAWLMDRDRKSPGLKRLQGHIWEDGYRAGQLRGRVYPDVAPSIQRWRAAGVRVAIYSSGSELAQRRLFESTPDGDLTGLFAGFFDTAVGPKTASESYSRIATILAEPPSAMLFVSDVTAELVAARAAGLQVVLSLREGNAPQPDAAPFASIRSLEEIRA